MGFKEQRHYSKKVTWNSLSACWAGINERSKSISIARFGILRLYVMDVYIHSAHRQTWRIYGSQLHLELSTHYIDSSYIQIILIKKIGTLYVENKDWLDMIWVNICAAAWPVAKVPYCPKNCRQCDMLDNGTGDIVTHPVRRYFMTCSIDSYIRERASILVLSCGLSRDVVRCELLCVVCRAELGIEGVYLEWVRYW